mmetsp:Transcript_7956/g.11891  ORF Transcript_7956/g.11891 Transcript_7956/m.11891 type:complete len:239 (-) Transcript_7956:328-1044(-)
MSSPKTDLEVQNAICEALTQTTAPIKPNKVRKWVCDKLAKGATWTQFADALDHLLKTKKVTECKEKEETLLQPLLSGNKTGTKEAAIVNKEQDENKDEHTIEMEIPEDIIHHLTRKGKRKQKNIEESTKTKFMIISSSTGEQKSSSLLKIVGDTKVHCDTAKIMMTKMLASYQKHPERYQPKKMAGGTLEEQAQARQLKENARKSKRHQHKKGDADAAEQSQQKEQQQPAKKKKRKFY